MNWLNRNTYTLVNENEEIIDIFDSNIDKIVFKIIFFVFLFVGTYLLLQFTGDQKIFKANILFYGIILFISFALFTIIFGNRFTYRFVIREVGKFKDEKGKEIGLLEKKPFLKKFYLKTNSKKIILQLDYKKNPKIFVP